MQEEVQEKAAVVDQAAQAEEQESVVVVAAVVVVVVRSMVVRNPVAVMVGVAGFAIPSSTATHTTRSPTTTPRRQCSCYVRAGQNSRDTQTCPMTLQLSPSAQHAEARERGRSGPGILRSRGSF